MSSRGSSVADAVDAFSLAISLSQMSDRMSAARHELDQFMINERLNATSMESISTSALSTLSIGSVDHALVRVEYDPDRDREAALRRARFPDDPMHGVEDKPCASDAMRCTVCYEHERCVFYNCGHTPVCGACHRRNDGRCPVCRETISHAFRSFH